MTPIERDHERGLNGALAAEIRAELAVRELSQTWLAERANMDRLTLRRYLKAQRAMNTALVEAICEALDLNPSELMARAVERRDKYPELYGPGATALSVHLGATGGEGEPTRTRTQITAHIDLAEPASTISNDEEGEAERAVDRLDRHVRDTRPTRKRSMQQLEDQAARDEDTGAGA